MASRADQQHDSGDPPSADLRVRAQDDATPLGQESLLEAQLPEAHEAPDIEEALEILRQATVNGRPLTEQEAKRLEQILSDTGLARDALASLVKRLAKFVPAGSSDAKS